MQRRPGQSMLPKVFRFLLNWNIEALDFKKCGRLFKTSVPFKCAELVPHARDLADGNERVEPPPGLYEKFLQLK